VTGRGMGRAHVGLGTTDRWGRPFLIFQDFSKPIQSLNSKFKIEIFSTSKKHETF
jgi:hypothetical protein